MNNISQSYYLAILKKLFLISFFIICVIPFSLNFNGGSSANYIFIFFPMLIILSTQSIKIPSDNIILILLIFCFIFFISLFYQFVFFKYFDRRIISFIIFMTVFSYLFININDEMVNAFKAAIVLFSCGFSLLKLGDYFLLQDVDGFSSKTTVGSQRYGFIFLLGFWILAFYQPRLILLKILKIVFILVILIGLMNTFSRSIIVALLGSVIIFLYTKINLKLKLPSFHSFLTFLKYLFVILPSGFLLWSFFPEQIDFYLVRILGFLFSGQFYDEIVQGEVTSSLGFRVWYGKHIVNFIGMNPFTGSGFLGCWVLFESLSCSAHSQYLDVLFRTGLFGFFLYIYILLRVFKYLRTTHRDLFFGFITILLVGVVHETFKLSLHNNKI